MKREITVYVEGNITGLLQAWSLPPDLAYRHTGNELELSFSSERLEEFHELEEVVERLKPRLDLEMVSLFKAYGFSPEELAGSTLVWLRALALPGLGVAGREPFQERRCGKCQAISSIQQDVERVQLRCRQTPRGWLLGAGTLVLCHRDLIRAIERVDKGRSLQVVPCEIDVEAGGTVDSYSWVHSTLDLGPPVRDYEFEVPCSACESLQVASNRSFITAFSRDRWSGEDFCTSSFFGLEMLYISQRIYDQLESRFGPDSGAVFEPVELV